jgi:hypothetical protein
VSGLSPEQKRQSLRFQVYYFRLRGKPWDWVAEHAGVSVSEAQYLLSEFFEERAPCEMAVN